MWNWNWVIWKQLNLIKNQNCLLVYNQFVFRSGKCYSYSNYKQQIYDHHVTYTFIVSWSW